MWYIKKKQNKLCLGIGMPGKIVKSVEVIINRYRLSTNSFPGIVNTKYRPKKPKEKNSTCKS